MKKVIYVASAIASALVIVYLVMPAERAEGVHEALMRFTDPDAVGCLDYERKLLKDPDSARIVSVEPGENSDEVKIRYKAKNGYGAYGTSEVVCVRGLLSSDTLHHDNAAFLTGVVRETLSLDQEAERLKHHIACLHDQNKLMMQGKSSENARVDVETSDPWCAAHRSK